MKFVFLFILLAGILVCPSQAIDCLEPGTRVVSRWTNGNYYKGEVESLTNRINVLFDTGVRHSYNTRDYEDILLDRIPDPTEMPWGNQIVVNRPRSRAFQIGYIWGFKNGRYVIVYENGDTIHHTLDQIRTFNNSQVCDEPAYIGCYRDSVPRYLQVFIPTHPSTIGACVEACKSEGFSIAGLRNSNLCFCGNQYTKDYQTEENQCDMPCYDNSFETCGGHMAFSQYWTGLVDSGRVARYPVQTSEKTNGQQGFYGYPQTGAQRHSIPKYGQIPWQMLMQARSQLRNSVANQAHASTWNPALTGRRWGGRPVYSNYGPRRSWYPSSSPAQYRTYPPHRNTRPYYYNKERGQTYSSWRRPQGNYRGQTYSSWRRPQGNYRGQTYSPWRRPQGNYRGPQQYAAGRSQTTTNKAQGSFSDSLRAVGWKLFGPKSKVFPASTNDIVGFRYLGCFRDSSIRDLPVAMDVRPLTVRSCVLKCRNSRYSVAGVQSSSQCFCGDSYSRYGRLRNEKCTMRCTGNYSEICGGEMKNDVFFTGYGTATPYEDLRAVRTRHPQFSTSKSSSRTTSISTKHKPALYKLRTNGPAGSKTPPSLEVKFLIKKIDKDLDRATKAGRLAPQQHTVHSLTRGKATNNGHASKTKVPPKKPLTHKQLKNILAVLSQWPTIDEKPKLKKPASSFKKLTKILDDMTPSFIKTLAYRIVSGSRRGRNRENKTGKRYPSVANDRKTSTRPKAIQLRLWGSKTNRNKSSDRGFLKLFDSKFNESKVPDAGGVRAKDRGEKYGGGTKFLRKSKEAKKAKFINAARDGVSSTVFKKNHSSVLLFKGAGNLSENATFDESSAEEPISGKWQHNNATATTLLTLEAGDKISKISHVLKTQAVKTTGKKEVGKKNKISAPIGKSITKQNHDKLTKKNSNPHKKMTILKKDKLLGEKAAGKTSKSPHKMFTKSKTKGTDVSREKGKALKKVSFIKNIRGKDAKTAKIINKAPEEEADTENFDDSNSLNQIISKGSHLSR